MDQSFLDALTNNRNLGFEEISRKNEEFREFSPEEKESLWEALHGYFSSAPISADQKYWWSYFRWYTELSWKHLLDRDRNFIINIAFPRQIVMAILLDFNVWKEFIWYLNVHPFTDKEMSAFYSNVKSSFFASTSVIGTWENKSVTLSQIIKETTIANQQKNSLRLAEVLSKLHELLFPENNPEVKKYLERYVYIAPEDAVSTLVDLISFFVGVEAEKIWYVVEGTVHEEKFELINQAQEAQTKREIASIRKPTLKIPVPTAPVSTSTPAVKSPTQDVSKQQSKPTQKTNTNSSSKNVSSTSSSRPSNKDIKRMIEEAFPALKQGKEINFEGVVSMLNTLANRYGDDRIRELYYYNEKSGSFEWNESLLV